MQLPAASPQPAIQPQQRQLATLAQSLTILHAPPLPFPQRIAIPPARALMAPLLRLALLRQRSVIQAAFHLRLGAVPAPPAAKLVAVVFAVPALLTAALKLSLEN